MLELIWFGKRKISNSLSIYIKTNTGSTLTIDLDPKWDIKNVKEIVAPQMGMLPDEIKIIFAGKELHNSTIIEECDLGQQSILHAVKAPPRRRRLEQNTAGIINERLSESSELDDTGGKPMNETLTDLSLNDDENETIKSKEQQGKRAHFFVFCSSPCKSIEAGKLRVRCALCGSEAVTVDRDPQSWPDVMLPNRITIHCENDLCQSDKISTNLEPQVPYAQFYFKCAKHPRKGEKDEAVPLYLIRPNLRKVPCLACTDIRDTVLVFPCEASHVTCLDCFKDYCTVRLSERQFEFDENTGYYTLSCPAGCPNSHIQEIHHFRMLKSAQYEQYQRFGAEEYVLRAGGLLCPQPDCGMGIIPPNSSDGLSEEECRKIQCIGGCGFVFCKKCLSGYHLGECDSQQPSTSNAQSRSGGYAVDPNRAKDAKWDDASTTAIKKLTKPCPQCRTPTERDGRVIETFKTLKDDIFGISRTTDDDFFFNLPERRYFRGCMHMVCTRAGCNLQWCWICQTTWSRDCMGNHWFG